MPANRSRTRAPRETHLRVIVMALALTFLASLGTITATPVEARNWTREISATRASQVYYENAMRAADREIKSLKRAHKQTKRKLKKAQRRHRAAVERRAAAKRKLATTRARFELARAALVASPNEAPPPPDATTAVLILLEPPSTSLVPTLVTAAADRRDSVFRPVSTALVADVGPAVANVTVEDVVALEREVKHQKRTLKKTKKRARRIARNVRSKRNAIASIKARTRSAVSRREGAEAGLASRILSMSRLAQHRVAKKTNVRPGINSGFVWPARGRISQTYGCTGFRLNPPRGSCRHFHDGIDIAGYRGSPIRAAAVGVVSYVGWNPWDQRGRAFIIVVAHPGGYETLYGHALPTRRVRVGELVNKGELIGYMGNTGRSTGVHLHLELRRGRTTLNPLAFL